MRGREVTSCPRAWEYPAWLHFMAQITLNKNKNKEPTETITLYAVFHNY